MGARKRASTLRSAVEWRGQADYGILPGEIVK